MKEVIVANWISALCRLQRDTEPHRTMILSDIHRMHKHVANTCKYGGPPPEVNLLGGGSFRYVERWKVGNVLGPTPKPTQKEPPPSWARRSHPLTPKSPPKSKIESLVVAGRGGGGVAPTKCRLPTGTRGTWGANQTLNVHTPWGSQFFVSFFRKCRHAPPKKIKNVTRVDLTTRWRL